MNAAPPDTIIKQLFEFVDGLRRPVGQSAQPGRGENGWIPGVGSFGTLFDYAIEEFSDLPPSDLAVSVAIGCLTDSREGWRDGARFRQMLPIAVSEITEKIRLDTERFEQRLEVGQRVKSAGRLAVEEDPEACREEVVAAAELANGAIYKPFRMRCERYLTSLRDSATRCRPAGNSLAILKTLKSQLPDVDRLPPNSPERAWEFCLSWLVDRKGCDRVKI